MIRYMGAAVALKLFSLNSITRSAYRSIGNRVGQKKRRDQSIDQYIVRGDLLIKLAQKYNILNDNTSLVELGTGWIHWFGLYLALYGDGDVKLELYDVWDNRQLDALKSSFGRLSEAWAKDASIGPVPRERLASMLAVDSFEALYEKFNANYTIDGDGSLAGYPSSAYDGVISFHVMEHIGRSFIENSINDMYRMLKPGGYCIHQIGIDDHLAHYDNKVSKKNYLQHSLSNRKYLFENVVQYHNVLQGADYQNFFDDAGFEVVEVSREKCDVSGLRIHPHWEAYSEEDHETTVLTIVCRKPL